MMWSMIETTAHQAGHWLPAITDVLRFTTALITFVLAASALVRRTRRRARSRTRRRRSGKGPNLA